MTTRHSYPYSVRKQREGRYSAIVRYAVVHNPGGKRVTSCPPATECTAWIMADRLNVWYLAANTDRFTTPDAQTLAERLILAQRHYRIFLPNADIFGPQRRAALDEPLNPSNVPPTEWRDAPIHR